MASHTAPAAASDQIMAERSFMHHRTGQAVHRCYETQHYDRSDQLSQRFIPCLHTLYGMYDMLYLVRLLGGAE